MRPAVAVAGLFVLLLLQSCVTFAALSPPVPDVAVRPAGDSMAPPLDALSPMPSSTPTNVTEMGERFGLDLTLLVGHDADAAPSTSPPASPPPAPTPALPEAPETMRASRTVRAEPPSHPDLAGVAGTATILGTAAWLLRRLLRSDGLRGLTLAGLFSRLRADRLMDNDVRARVHEDIARHPGASLEQVRTRTGIARATASHHLRRLERHGLLTAVRQGARRRYFVATGATGSTALPPARLRDAAALSHPTARGIAAFVQDRPGVDQQEVCSALAIRNPAASKHLTRFEALGLVVAERRGRNRHYHPTDGLRLALAVLSPAVQAVPGPPAAGVPAAPVQAAPGPSASGSPTNHPPPGRPAPARPTVQVTPPDGA